MAKLKLEIRWAISGSTLSNVQVLSNDTVRQLEEKVLQRLGTGHAVKLVCASRVLAPHERLGDVLSNNSIVDVVCRKNQVSGWKVPTKWQIWLRFKYLKSRKQGLFELSQLNQFVFGKTHFSSLPRGLYSLYRWEHQGVGSHSGRVSSHPLWPCLRCDFTSLVGWQSLAGVRLRRLHRTCLGLRILGMPTRSRNLAKSLTEGFWCPWGNHPTIGLAIFPSNIFKDIS